MTDAPADAAATLAFVTVDLDRPIKRGDKTIGFVQLRKPKAGELRGLSLVDLAQLDVTALTKLLPRITNPTLTAHDVAELDPADLLALGSEVSGFLLQKAARPASLDQ